MRAARYYGRHDVRVDDVEKRAVGPTDVRVAVAACGICGSDRHEYSHGPITAPATSPHPLSGESIPIRLGHEFAGRVADVGADVTDVSVGERVAVNPIRGCDDCQQCLSGHYNRCPQLLTIGLQGGAGGFAESAVVPAENVVLVPDSIPLDHGALVEPFSVALHALRQATLQAGDSVAVFGAGAIGLCVVQAAIAAGASTVYVSELEPSLRALAEDLGATVAIDPREVDPVRRVSEATDGGVDVAVEAVGVEQTFTQAVRASRRGGTVTVIGVFDASVDLDPNQLMMAERTVTGTFGYQAGPASRTGEFATVLEYMRDGRVQPEPLVTDRIGLDDIVTDGFERLAADGDDAAVRVLVEP